MSAPLRLVMFDMDGTLIDSQDFILAAMHRAFGGLGTPLPGRAEVLAIVGLSLDEAFGRLAPHMDARARGEAVAMYRDAAQALRMEGADSAPLFPGARAALSALHRCDEVLLGVATGKARRGLDHVCAAHDLDHFFVTRQTADLHPSKPHPAMLLAALEATGVEPGRAVMVGDTTFDIEMARAAGFASIGVSWGYHDARMLREAGADLLVDDFAGLSAALQQIWEST